MMDDLRSWWEVPSIAHFCSLFRSAFDLTDFDIEDLEEAFLESTREEGSEFLIDLVCRLLNGCYARKDISAENFDLYVKDIIKYKWEQGDNPIKERSEFHQLSLREKVEFIHAVCEYRLDTEDVVELLKGFEGDNMRVEPLGKDKDGGVYWYFYGSRLYKEDPDPKKELTKEEKKAKEKERKRKDKQKKMAEKQKRKKEREKLKAQKKMEKKKRLEEALQEKESRSSIRRSGRIKLRQLEEEIPSDSSSLSASDSETEESDDSATEEEPVEEVVETKSKKGRGKKTPAKKETPAKPETPDPQTSTKRKRGRPFGSTKKKKTKTATTPAQPVVEKETVTDSGVRRSGRARRRKGEPAPPPPKFDDSGSETEDENDVDSGHESAETDDDNKSVRSEVSKVSVQSVSTPRSRGRPVRKPQSKLELKRTSLAGDEDKDEEDKDEDGTDKIGVEEMEDEDTLDNNIDETENNDFPVITEGKEQEAGGEEDSNDVLEESEGQVGDVSKDQPSHSVAADCIEKSEEEGTKDAADTPGADTLVTMETEEPVSEEGQGDKAEVDTVTLTNGDQTEQAVDLTQQEKQGNPSEEKSQIISEADKTVDVKDVSKTADEITEKTDEEQTVSNSKPVSVETDVGNTGESIDSCNGKRESHESNPTKAVENGSTEEGADVNKLIAKSCSELEGSNGDVEIPEKEQMCSEQIEVNTKPRCVEFENDVSESNDGITEKIPINDEGGEQLSSSDLKKELPTTSSSVEDTKEGVQAVKNENLSGKCVKDELKLDESFKEEKPDVQVEETKLDDIKVEKDDIKAEVKEEVPVGQEAMVTDSVVENLEGKDFESDKPEGFIKVENENSISKEEDMDTDTTIEDTKSEIIDCKVEKNVEVKDMEKLNLENNKTEDRKDAVLQEDSKTKDSENVKSLDVKSSSRDTVGKASFKLDAKPCVKPSSAPSNTRWHLICQSLDDWVNLAEWFKDSMVRCEKSLAKVIREDFIPVLPEIIEAREAEKKKRLQELEVRRSHRLTMKQKEKIEQEKILAEAQVEEEKARQLAEEERRLREEQLRLEEENRQREERIKAREERAKRLYIREEKARLLAEGKEIPPELIYTGNQKYKDDSDSDDSRCELRDDELESLTKIIDAMKIHKDCWPFLEPVTDEQAPGYSDVIKRPMDISKIERKVIDREYKTTRHFMSDFKLMFNNCKRFNGQDSDFSECARSMEKMLKKYVKRFLSDEPTDSYYEDKDFTMSVRAGAAGEKKFRPKRAASSRALQTVHKALNNDDEDYEEEEESDEDRPYYTVRRKTPKESPIRTPSHHSLLLQEMIELKRQRERKLAASALENHKTITRGPERVRLPNPSGGVMIIPKDELPPTGVLRLAATREIKRKVTSRGADGSKRDPEFNVYDKTKGNSKLPKTIRIVAASQNSSGSASVRECAESVKVSADGFLIIGGKNSGIRVSDNTKIVIQPPGTAPTPGTSGSPGALVKELYIKKAPPPVSKPAVVTTTAPATSAVAVHTLTFHSSQAVVGPSPQSKPVVKQAVDEQQLEKMIQVTKQQARNVVAQNKDSQKQLDIAQRIAQLNAQKKKIIQQRQMMQHKHQAQQNGPSTSGANPPKIMRLEASPQPVTEPKDSSEQHMTIEDRLREGGADTQIGNVTQNIVGSVNIASDILETYYSVLNSTNTTTTSSLAGSPAVVHVSASGSAKPVVGSVTFNVNQGVPSVNPSSSSSSLPVSSPASETNIVTEVSNGPSNVAVLISSGSSETLTAVPVQNVVAMSTPGSVQIASVNSNVPLNLPTVLDMKEEVQIVRKHQMSTPTVVQTLDASFSGGGAQNLPSVPEISCAVVADPMDSKVTEQSAIETLFSSGIPTTLANISVPATVQMVGNLNMEPKPQPMGSSGSPEKSNRPSLFDMFEPVKESAIKTIVANEFGFAGLNEKPASSLVEEPSKKVRLQGVVVPGSGTVNIGSPLKTSSIMEALKSKLQPPKVQQAQNSESHTLEGPMEAQETASVITEVPVPADSVTNPGVD